MDKKCLEKSYNLAIAARNFHYDNFNKWMTFYYVAIGAVLVAFFQIDNSLPGKGDIGYLKVTLLILGFIISIFWHLACKGYYFWMKNWIRIIIKIESELEKEEEYRLYSIFCKEVFEKDNNLVHPMQSANISTSKVTLAFSFLVCVTWAFLLLFHFTTNCFSCSFFWLINLFLAILISTSCIYVVGIYLKSDFSNHTFVKG